MSDFDREELAFRAALREHADEAPTAPVEVRRHRRWWPASVAAAILVAVVTLPFLLHDEGPTGPSDPPRPERAFRWVGYGDVEVKVPKAWQFDYGVTRPDCIRQGYDDPWAKGIPRRPYVEVDGDGRAVEAIGCFWKRPEPADFYAPPFAMWQPYVQLRRANLNPGMSTATAYRDGTFTYRGWRLARKTISGVQVSVLAPPDDLALTDWVLDSARVVKKNIVGCDTAPQAAEGEPAPSREDVPAPGDIDEVAICLYGGKLSPELALKGSHRMTGRPARRLARAIEESPAASAFSPGPWGCKPDFLDETRVALRFYAVDGRHLADAWLVLSSCHGNGVVTATGTKALTRSACSTVFSQPPVVMWSGEMGVFKLCDGYRMHP